MKKSTNCGLVVGAWVLGIGTSFIGRPEDRRKGKVRNNEALSTYL